MLNREKHQLIMGQILRDIYTDTSIAPLLGLKGGTCAYFFYGLPRFSVDLDFDLLSVVDDSSPKNILSKIIAILEKYGKVKDSHIKQFTIFALLSYGDEDHNIKVEISTRTILPDIKDYYVLKEHLGISMLVGKKEYLFSSKLAALMLRSEIVMRDVYDIYYFAKNNWNFNKEIVELRTNKKFSEYIADCIEGVETIKDNQVLSGLGELVNEKEKDWIRQKLRKEAVFYLKNYQAVIK